MPGESGIELAIKFAELFPACAVLLISGQAETGDLLETASQRGYHFEIVAKPLWPPDLIRHAEQLLQRSTSASASL